MTTPSAVPPSVLPLAEPAPQRRRTLILLVIAVALFWSSLYFYASTLPVYVQSKSQDLAAVGVVLAMYGLWQGLVRFPLGILSDWFGRRKPFILLGFVFAALGALLMGSATGATGLITGRAVTGLAAAAWVPMTVFFSSLFPKEEAVRATALLTLSNTLSRMVATGINGTLNKMGGYELAFWVAIGAAALGVLVVLPIREVARAPKRPSATRILALISNRHVLLPAGLSIVAQYIAWSTTFGFLPVLARNLGADGQTQSLLLSLNLGVGLAGNLITTALARRGVNTRLIYLSFLVLFAGVTIAGLSTSISMILVAQLLLGLGDGISGPLLMGMCIQKINDTERSTAMGLYQAVYAIGMFGGPWLSGILADRMGIPPMFLLTAFVTVVVAMIGARFLTRGE